MKYLKLISIQAVTLLMAGCASTQEPQPAPQPKPQPVVKKEPVKPVGPSQEELNQQRSESILKELKLIPVHEYQKNYKLYKELVDLNPGNQYYLGKMKFYKKEMAETVDILNRLKSIPVKEYQKNYDLYRRLVEIHPGDKYYERKLAFYADRLNKPTPDDNNVTPAEEVLLDMADIDEMRDNDADATSMAQQSQENQPSFESENYESIPIPSSHASCSIIGHVKAGKSRLQVMRCDNGTVFSTPDGARSRKFNPVETAQIRQAFVDASGRSSSDYSDRHKLYRKKGIVIYVRRPANSQWHAVFAFSDILHSPKNVRLKVVPKSFDALASLLKR